LTYGTPSLLIRLAMVFLVLGTTWTYGGIGLNPATPIAELAAAAAARAREHRCIAREESAIAI
jgi:hypothetical protein